MCAFIPIAMAVIAMASTAMQIQQQNKAAEVAAENANQAAATDYLILNRKQDEIGRQQANEATERMRQGERERAKMRVAMGESGVGGASQVRTLANSFMQEGYDIGITEYNRDAHVLGVQDEKFKTYTDAQGRVNTAKSNTVSPLMAGLQIGMSGAKGAMSTYTGGGSGGASAASSAAKTDIYGNSWSSYGSS